MASRSVNKVILVGNLGRDAETKFTPSGAAVTRFSIATTRSWKDQQSNEWKEETNWSNVVLWRQENLANYLTKGKQVYVEGRLQTRSYDDKDGKKVYATEVVAEEVILLGGRGESAPGVAVEEPERARRRRKPIRTGEWALQMMMCRFKTGFRERVHFGDSAPLSWFLAFCCSG
jgi:single-strand DNA-binding protein